MAVKSVRRYLEDASREIRSACDLPTDVENEEWLERIADHLDHFVEGRTDDPEAMVYPSADVMDTIDERLTEVIDRTEDEAVLEHLETARSRVREAIESLDRRY